MALKTAPVVFDRVPADAGLDDAELSSVLRSYFFFAGALVFGAYVIVRRSAARIYAAAVLGAVRAGELAPERWGISSAPRSRASTCWP